MSPAIFPTVAPVVAENPPVEPSTQAPHPASTNGHGSAWVPSSSSNAVSQEVFDRLEIYIAGPQEHASIADLATRVGCSRPDGALMVAALEGRLLAAGSMSDGAVVNEPSPSGTAAAAVVRYRLAGLKRERRARRVIPATS
jgi:hypothetical protein